MKNFYAQHRIHVRHHNLPCVIDYDCYGNVNYYPLELVIPICFTRGKCQKEQEKSTQTDDDIDDFKFISRTLL